MTNCVKEKHCKKSIPSDCRVCPSDPIAQIVYHWGGANKWNVTNFYQPKKNYKWVFSINGLREQGQGEPLNKFLNNYFGFK